MEKLLNVKELAEMLSVSRATVYRLKDKGLPFVKVGSSLRFDPQEVKNWIAENQ